MGYLPWPAATANLSVIIIASLDFETKKYDPVAKSRQSQSAWLSSLHDPRTRCYPSHYRSCYLAAVEVWSSYQKEWFHPKSGIYIYILILRLYVYMGGSGSIWIHNVVGAWDVWVIPVMQFSKPMGPEINVVFPKFRSVAATHLDLQLNVDWG